MEEEKRTEWENIHSNEKAKPKDRFIIKYIIFVIILILITVAGIYFTIRYIDEEAKDIAIPLKQTIESNEEEEKKVAEDSKYAIKSYSETYDTNSLEIKIYNDTDGEIVEENKETRLQAGVNPQDFKYNINFVQIDGLKNIEVQNKINAKLKSLPYTLEKEKYVWSSVTANFSNVLSVVITNDITYSDDAKTLNFDLTTGEEIPFEKLFVSSAPIKSMIAGGMYKNFAWDELYEKYEEYDGYLDMNNVDASTIEDEILLAVSKYNKIKDEIVYSFSLTTIYIYNSELRTEINMAEYAKEIAVYKRYLIETSIFENNSIGTKGLIVFTADIVDNEYTKQISYGKIKDNIFVEEILLNWDGTDEEELEVVIEYVEKLSKEQQTILKQETSNNKGVIFQGEYYVSKDIDKGYYLIQTTYYKAECLISYFEDKAFKDYIKVKGMDRVEAGLNGFASYMKNDYPDMQISETEYKSYFLSLTGEFLGNTLEEVESKAWE